MPSICKAFFNLMHLRIVVLNFVIFYKNVINLPFIVVYNSSLLKTINKWINRFTFKLCARNLSSSQLTSTMFTWSLRATSRRVHSNWGGLATCASTQWETAARDWCAAVVATLVRYCKFVFDFLNKLLVYFVICSKISFVLFKNIYVRNR